MKQTGSNSKIEFIITIRTVVFNWLSLNQNQTNRVTNLTTQPTSDRSKTKTTTKVIT